MKTQTIAVLVAVAVVGGTIWYIQKPSIPGLIGQQTVPSLMPIPTTTTPAPQATSEVEPAPQTTPVPAAGTKTYANPAYGFRFEYPSSMNIETAVSPGGFTALGAVGVVGAFIRIDTVAERFSVSVSKEPADVGTCTDSPGNKWVTTVQGVPFVTYQVKESKEGQNITSTVYRIMRGPFCYELRDTVVSSVTAELTAHQNAQQNANITAAGALVESIVQSFRFTQ